MMDSAGNFYGTPTLGGASGNGVVWQITPKPLGPGACDEQNARVLFKRTSLVAKPYVFVKAHVNGLM